MTAKLRNAMQYVIDNVNDIPDDDYMQFMDDLICNLDVHLNEEADEERDF